MEPPKVPEFGKRRRLVPGSVGWMRLHDPEAYKARMKLYWDDWNARNPDKEAARKARAAAKKKNATGSK